MRITEVPPKQLGTFWPLCSYWIQTACERSGGRENLERCMEQLIDNRARLVIVVDRGACIAASLVTLHDDALHILALGGCEIRRWTDGMLDKYKEIATDQHRAAVTLEGRKGWKRYLRGYGFKEVESMTPENIKLRWAI